MSTIEWPDTDGNFLLSDGSRGNPGCDECGMRDAIVKVGGRYLCHTEDLVVGIEAVRTVLRDSEDGYLVAVSDVARAIGDDPAKYLPD